jgi:GxxExxY protein
LNHEDAKFTKQARRNSLPKVTEMFAREVVDAAYSVHVALGPGLLESICEACLDCELRAREVLVERQVAIPIAYRSLQIESGLRLDMVVGGCVVVELKAVETLLPVHRAQLLSYLRLSGHRLGFLLNFHSHLMKDGIQRFIV